jgi:glyoxylase-like metal-dependent hydrolase (beta-lactamase superfamily II)
MHFDVIPIMTVVGNAYLVKGERVALVDTLSPWRYRKLLQVLDRFNVSPRDIEFILITHHHFDHCGNLAKLKQLSGATIIAGEADAPVIEGTAPTPPPSRLNRLGKALGKMPEPLVNRYQRFEHVKVDLEVRGGEIIEELGLKVLALPGHTAGGVGYHDLEGRRAFIGDMVSYFYSYPMMPSLSASESIEQIHDSQELLAGLGLDIAYTGHGAVLEPDASKIISDFVAGKKAKTRR